MDISRIGKIRNTYEFAYGGISTNPNYSEYLDKLQKQKQAYHAYLKTHGVVSNRTNGIDFVPVTLSSNVYDKPYSLLTKFNVFSIVRYAVNGTIKLMRRRKTVSNYNVNEGKYNTDEGHKNYRT